jgi:hypothetical protein
VEYSAALNTDLIHYRSLLKEQKLQPALVVGRMILARASFQNIVSDLQSWNEEAKEVKDHVCINHIKPMEPKVFVEEDHWKIHVTRCYKHRFKVPMAGSKGRGRHRRNKPQQTRAVLLANLKRISSCTIS